MICPAAPALRGTSTTSAKVSRIIYRCVFNSILLSEFLFVQGNDSRGPGARMQKVSDFSITGLMFVLASPSRREDRDPRAYEQDQRSNCCSASKGHGNYALGPGAPAGMRVVKHRAPRHPQVTPPGPHFVTYSAWTHLTEPTVMYSTRTFQLFLNASMRTASDDGDSRETPAFLQGSTPL